MLQMCPTHAEQSLISPNKDEQGLNGLHPYPANSSMSFQEGKHTALSFYKRRKLLLQDTENDIPCETPISLLRDLNSEPNPDVLPLKTCESDSRYDSCSSSRSNTEQISENTRYEVPGACESSSSTHRLEESKFCETSERDKCIALLRENGVLKRCYYRKKRKYTYAILQCTSCLRKGSVRKMIICDSCEGVYHLKCCYILERELPFVDEWLCPKCRLRKFNKLKRDGIKHSTNIMDGRRKNKNPGRIVAMLRDTKPYISDVRVGKGFQADVPVWSGPVDDDNETIGEPLELDTSAIVCSNKTRSFECCEKCFSSNWLQCKGISDASQGFGTVCGKWRRAPHPKAQTNDWDCFSAIFWDAAHADCAAAQEVETDEVLRQVTRMQKMRPQPEVHSKEMIKLPNALSIKKDLKQVYVRKRTPSQ